MSSIGTICRQAREAKGISQADAATETHIKAKYIEGIEADDFSAMPATLYAKGFVKIYAEFLGLDPAPLLLQFAKPAAGSRRPSITQPPVRLAPSQVRKVEQSVSPPPVAPAPPAPAAQKPPVATAVVAPRSAAMPPPAPVARMIETRPPVPAPQPVAPPEQAPVTRVPEARPPADNDNDRNMRLLDRAGDAPGDLFNHDLVRAILRYLPIGVGVLIVVVLLLSGMNHCARKRHAGTDIAQPAIELVPAKQSTVKHGALRLGQEPPLPYLDERK